MPRVHNADVAHQRCLRVSLMPSATTAAIRAVIVERRAAPRHAVDIAKTPCAHGAHEPGAGERRDAASRRERYARVRCRLLRSGSDSSQNAASPS